MSEIPKAYEPRSVEEKWYQFWCDESCFTADPARVNAQRPGYSIVIPPPNVTGMLHLGHVLNNTIQDILARKARMDGKEVLWLPGTDHAGIATQVQVEKALKREEKKTKHDLGREEFLKRVWAWKEKHGGIIIQQLKKLGCSCDWTRERFTMDAEYSRCVQKVFVDLYQKGLIYRGKRMVNWCPVSQTALSDEEVEMKPQKGFLWYFKVEVADAPETSRPPATGAEAAEEGAEDGKPTYGPIVENGKTYLLIATTRPETIPGDTAIAVNPKDPRYAHLVGKHVIRPLPVENQARIPIVADEHIDIEFGTGVLKVTPAHDKADFEIMVRAVKSAGSGEGGCREIADMVPLEVVGPDGSMTDLAGADLKGLDRFEARKVAAAKLEEIGALVKEERYENNVGFSQRADVPIEPRLSEQWFLKYPSVEQASACVEQANSSDKTVELVRLTGKETPDEDRAALRRSALQLARKKGWIGRSFRNEDTGWEILIRRKSLSHAFNNRNPVAIRATAVLPELIRTAVHLRAEAHEPMDPRVRQVHHFIAALEWQGEIHTVPVVVKELADGRMVYDYKAKKAAFGGKPLVAHPPEGKLGIQPAPNAAGVSVALLSESVKPASRTMRFHPDRWAKVYDHWLSNIQDWCISRQLWWGHRIPVWSIDLGSPARKTIATEAMKVVESYRSQGANVDDDIYVPELQEVTPASLKEVPSYTGLVRYQVFIGPEHPDLATRIESLRDSAEPQASITQDPDVLDTWFSSWLWPFATMGWTGDPAVDAQNPMLKAFYPTSDLVTGPDIIFFWVARMIMAGYEFMGDLPFHNVYFTGIIRDKQGRKMSKTLGNSPDPLDLIAKFGADALRFGVMRSAPLGQDVLFDEKDVEQGRNFCNKLWNACRFRQMQGGEGEGEINPALLGSDDQWILLRLDQAIREIDDAFADYKFNEVTATLYRFFWNEFCDWYLEASKAAFQGSDPARKANVLAVIDFVLGHMLRLFHPFLPFITEELWHDLGYAEDLPDEQGGKTIMVAHWPKPFDDDFKAHYGLEPTAEQLANAKYDLVTKGRNFRREFNIPANRKVAFALRPAGQLASHEADVIRLLLNAETLEVNPDYVPPKGTPSAHSPLGELYLPLEGLIDVEAEKARLTKELSKVEVEIQKVEQKLGNENFTSRAPEPVLAEHRQRLAAWQARKEQIKAAVDCLS